ncbi:MAG: hypothetical protein GXY38_02490, partial [Planctomycetes bacterium]|nr:hypothetical protein [Planctomycetota bacterium]
MPSPCFDELLRVLDRKAPTRPTLFEFFMNAPLYDRLTNGRFQGAKEHSRQYWRRQILAFTNAGYDYVNIRSCDFAFPGPEVRQEASRSLNEGASIADRPSFEAYPWPKPEDCDYSCIEELAPELPKGSKFIVWGPGGVLENAIALVGYQNLCMMTMDDPELTRDL